MTQRAANNTLLQMALAIAAASRSRAHDVVVEQPKHPVRREKGAPIDFHAVPPHQREIDGRLRNWGIWCNSKQAASSSPMFRLASAPVAVKRDALARAGNTLDRTDAIRIAQAVTALPEKHAAALNWCYVKPVSPRRAAESIGVSMENLAALLTEGRQMLINRLG